MKPIFLTAYACILALAIACENPADNKPKATINEPAATPAATVAAPVSTPEAAAASTIPAATEALATTTTTAAAPSGTQTFKLMPPDSKIGFTGSKVTGKHIGGFGRFTGEIVTDGQNVETSTVNVQIDATTIFADNPKLTGHLRTPDFFDVAKFPTAAFKSTQITKDGAGYKLTGDLTLHGVTKNISFPAKIELSPTQATAQAEFSINRKDFGIMYAGKTNDLIRDEVLIHLDIKAVPG